MVIKPNEIFSGLVIRCLSEWTNFIMEIRIICKHDKHLIMIVFQYLK